MLHDDLKRVWNVLKLNVPTGEKAKMLNMSEGDFRKVVRDMFAPPEVMLTLV